MVAPLPLDVWAATRARQSVLIAAAAIAVVLTLGNLDGIGIWEPWEANEIRVAQEYSSRGEAPDNADPAAASWNGAVPTFDGQPIERSLLKTWLVSRSLDGLDTSAIGALERGARTPIAVATLLLAIASMAWLWRRFGAMPAAVTTVVFVSCPAVYLGTHNLGAEMLFVVTTSFTIIAFAELMLSDKTASPTRRWLWGVLFGVSLALSVLDQRLLGLFLVLLVIGTFAVSETLLGEAIRQRDGPAAPRRFGAVEVVGAGVALLATAATVAWMWRGRGANGTVPPYMLQVGTCLVLTFVSSGMLWFGRKSKPGRAFFSAPGLVGAAIGVLAAVWLARAYSAANPILLDGGELFGSVRVLEYMLSHHIFESSIIEKHVTFDVMMRQVGFGMFPWIALFPLGLVWASQATSMPDSKQSGAALLVPQMVIRRLLLVWMVVAAVLMGAASAWNHYTYPATLAIAACIGLSVADREWWAKLRQTPLAGVSVGFVAIMIVLMIGKDLERFPVRFIETLVVFQDKVELGTDFTWGSLYKPLKYVVCAAIALYFFGLLSSCVLYARRALELRSNWRATWAALRARDWGKVWGDPPTQPAFAVRMAQKDELHGQFRLLRFIETPSGFAPALALLMAGVAFAFLYSFVPNATNHLSQRGVFETYKRLAGPEDRLVRYQIASRDYSVYLADIDTVMGAPQFGEMFEGPRFFAIVPRSKLAAINYEIRQRTGRNVPVLDARSSRLLLVSNKLEAGEVDHSFVNDKIVEGEPQLDFPLAFGPGGAKKAPTFDGQLEFLGYSLDRKAGSDGLVEYEWGSTMTLTYYFRVLKRVASSQKIFLHVDYPGTRINGDHTPNNGEFTTNYWLPGDVVKAVQPLVIESYSTPGVYSMHMGFFIGSRRMKVEPREAHDGRDRVTIGQIRVKGL